jgi:hypothetical protein
VRCLFPEARTSLATPAVLPPTTASDPITTAIRGMPIYVTINRRPANTPRADNQPTKILQNPPAGAAAPWPLTNNFIPSQVGQSVPPYATGGYNQFHTLYYPPYPEYSASVPVIPFSGNNAKLFPIYPPIPPSVPRGALGAYRPTTENNLTPIKEHLYPIVPPANRPLSANRDEPYIPKTRPPPSNIHR